MSMLAAGLFGLMPLEIAVLFLVFVVWPWEIWTAISEATHKRRSPIFWGIIVGLLVPVFGLIPLAILTALPTVAMSSLSGNAPESKPAMMQH